MAEARAEKEQGFRFRDLFPEAFVWLALILLASSSWLIAYLPVGSFHTVAALGIAAVKALLVVIFFMHLKHSSAVVRMASAVGIIWLMVLFTFTLSDYLSRATGEGVTSGPNGRPPAFAPASPPVDQPAPRAVR